MSRLESLKVFGFVGLELPLPGWETANSSLFLPGVQAGCWTKEPDLGKNRRMLIQSRSKLELK